MKAVMFGAQTIMLGQSVSFDYDAFVTRQDVIVSGGFESMSNTPYYIEKARYGIFNSICNLKTRI